MFSFPYNVAFVIFLVSHRRDPAIPIGHAHASNAIYISCLPSCLHPTFHASSCNASLCEPCDRCVCVWDANCDAGGSHVLSSASRPVDRQARRGVHSPGCEPFALSRVLVGATRRDGARAHAPERRAAIRGAIQRRSVDGNRLGKTPAAVRIPLEDRDGPVVLRRREHRAARIPRDAPHLRAV